MAIQVVKNKQLNRRAAVPRHFWQQVAETVRSEANYRGSLAEALARKTALAGYLTATKKLQSDIAAWHTQDLKVLADGLLALRVAIFRHKNRQMERAKTYANRGKMPNSICEREQKEIARDCDRLIRDLEGVQNSVFRSRSKNFVRVLHQFKKTPKAFKF